MWPCVVAEERGFAYKALEIRPRSCSGNHPPPRAARVRMPPSKLVSFPPRRGKLLAWVWVRVRVPGLGLGLGFLG